MLGEVESCRKIGGAFRSGVSLRGKDEIKQNGDLFSGDTGGDYRSISGLMHVVERGVLAACEVLPSQGVSTCKVLQLCACMLKFRREYKLHYWA